MDLITKKTLLRDRLQPDWVGKTLEAYGIKADEAHFIQKGIVPENVQFKKGERSSVDYITTKTVDRDREIVLPQGAVLDDYRKHPVVLFCHNYKEMPVGKALWIKIEDNGLVAKTQYAKTARGNEVYDYRKDGFPMAKSIGFVPLEVVEKEDFDKVDLKSMDLEEKDLEGADRIFPKWLMLEYSDVPVPANPDALQLAISKGLLDQEKALEYGYVIEFTDTPVEDCESNDGYKQWITMAKGNVINKPETTEQYHHIPIKSASDFVDGSFRTISISADEGIKAVIGKLKSDPDGSTTVQKYLFDRSCE